MKIITVEVPDTTDLNKFTIGMPVMIVWSGPGGFESVSSTVKDKQDVPTNPQFTLIGLSWLP